MSGTRKGSGLPAGKTIYLVRHGAIASRYRDRFIGKTDVALSAEGRKQAGGLAARFRERPGLAVVSSPLRRARVFARLLAPGLNGSLRLWPGLREMDFGRWEGLNFGEIRRRDPDQVARWAVFAPGFRFPGGESLRSFRRRLGRVRKALLRHPAREVLAVSHGGVIRSLLCLWKGMDLSRYPAVRVRQGTVSVVRVKRGRPRVVSVGLPPGEFKP